MSVKEDIIFLLLIFFMLTSSLVAPNALNLKLPGSSRSQAAPAENPTDVSINRAGVFYLDGKKLRKSKLEEALRRLARGSKKKVNITISPEKGTPIEHVVTVMDIALRLNINAILATDVK
ncbi:MAG: biopolymer transporter ExbD, partial [Bacteroidota bacterium]